MLYFWTQGSLEESIVHMDTPNFMQEHLHSWQHGQKTENIFRNGTKTEVKCSTVGGKALKYVHLQQGVHF